MNYLELIKDATNIADLEPETLIHDKEELDSIALLGLYSFLEQKGFKIALKDFIDCKTIGDLIELLKNVN